MIAVTKDAFNGKYRRVLLIVSSILVFKKQIVIIETITLDHKLDNIYKEFLICSIHAET